ncbi:MAG: DUF4469 domain-containing protein [Treponema sp.]|nr:DUF4469 domain-containing protein [Treponema sp.]
MTNPNFKSADSILSVSLRKNHFVSDENSFVGHVTRNTVTLENLIADISEKNNGVSPYMIQHVASLLGDEMLKACQNAKAVDVLGLGTLYITVNGSVSGTNPGESSIPGFKLNFTPSQRAQESVDSLKVDKVIITDSNPVINTIINTFNQDQNDSLMKNKGVKIIGSKLKIAGTESGIWFAPVLDDGEANKDESTWVPVDNKTISHNTAKKLEFYVPNSLTDAEYRIVIRTKFSSGGRELQTPVTAISKIVTIVS